MCINFSIHNIYCNVWRLLMKALAKQKEPGIWMIDAPEPECGPNDLLIKIKITAICGTDVHIYNWDAWSQKLFRFP